MESTTYLLSDSNGKDHAIFSGDTLFLGDVGRPDLAQKHGKMTKEQLAETLFDSLRNKIMPLADDITVYPAHGAGSACGKKMMKETDTRTKKRSSTPCVKTWLRKSLSEKSLMAWVNRRSIFQKCTTQPIVMTTLM